MAKSLLKGRTGQGGFTLLEVLIAFVIAAAALTALTRAGIDGLLALNTASRYEEALTRAQSRLATALHGAPLLPGTLEGDDGGGFRWRVQVRLTDGPTLQPLGSRGARRLMRVQTVLYAVSVQVWWGAGDVDAAAPRVVRLDTLHVVSNLLPRETAAEAAQ
jgi:general secretion pathway protein I